MLNKLTLGAEYELLVTLLKEAKKKLNESQSKPVRLRRKRDTGESKVIADGAASITKLEDGLTNLKHTNEVQTHIQNGSTPQLLIPALSSKTRPPKRLSEGRTKLAVGSQGGTLVGLTSLVLFKKERHLVELHMTLKMIDCMIVPMLIRLVSG
ncbi:hypothetical protein EJ110_NYTH55021 [Nymphaea thermarum]|nr:hypothetical protein EJ110_NYTH55021 [Nymphaea thermarum]